MYGDAGMGGECARGYMCLCVCVCECVLVVVGAQRSTLGTLGIVLEEPCFYPFLFVSFEIEYFIGAWTVRLKLNIFKR